MKALILVNGELNSPGVLRRRIRAGTFDLVLAPIGVHAMLKPSMAPLMRLSAIFDSLSDSARQNIGNAEFISYPTGKNETDLELTLLYAKEREPTVS